MLKKIRLGISSCLIGERVRYDGGHKLDNYLKDTLGTYVDWVPVCPEVEYGLPVPREAMRLVGTPESPRLVTVRTGVDHTEGMLRWASARAGELNREGLCGFIFKSRSPSSGMRGVKVYAVSGVPGRSGTGIFARVFMERFPVMPVEDDGRMQDPAVRENFIERIFVFRRWRDFIAHDNSLRGLVEFHTDHKLLIMAHSQGMYRVLGKLVAGAKQFRRSERYQEYITRLMEGLRLMATVKKNTDVLMHSMGYLKKSLSADEQQELLEAIRNYQKRLVPLIVPVTLLLHYVRKFDEPYLKRQYYLNPHPVELMLRNHT